MAFKGFYIKETVEGNIDEVYATRLTSAYYKLENVYFYDNNNNSDNIEEDSEYNCFICIEVCVFEQEEDRRNQLPYLESISLIIHCNKDDSFDSLWSYFYNSVKTLVVNTMKIRLVQNEETDDLLDKYTITLEDV